MPQTIQIKRSTSTASPSSLANGELAYSSDSNKLFIGRPGGGTGDIDAIGGKLYTDMLDHTAGTLTASSAVLTDANSKVDALKTANLTIGANSITSCFLLLNFTIPILPCNQKHSMSWASSRFCNTLS